MVQESGDGGQPCIRRVSLAGKGSCQGCEVVVQIKDDILVHGTEDTHEGRLQKVLHKLQEAGFTLR